MEELKKMLPRVSEKCEIWADKRKAIDFLIQEKDKSGGSSAPIEF